MNNVGSKIYGMINGKVRFSTSKPDSQHYRFVRTRIWKGIRKIWVYKNSIKVRQCEEN